MDCVRVLPRSHQQWSNRGSSSKACHKDETSSWTPAWVLRTEVLKKNEASEVRPTPKKKKCLEKTIRLGLVTFHGWTVKLQGCSTSSFLHQKTSKPIPAGAVVFFLSDIWYYCWWFRNPANQLLRLVSYPIISTVLWPSRVVVWDFSHQPYRTISRPFSKRFETANHPKWPSATKNDTIFCDDSHPANQIENSNLSQM